MTWTSTLSRFSLAFILLFLITIFHAVGLYSFTHGFLLTRLSIPNISPAYVDGPPVQPTHSKAVILVIDALRTDFLTHDRPDPSPYHHGILTLPSELTRRQPEHSLIFNTFSDPPTSSMQRLKAITTGSLPTFIDAGSNFASTAIEEDSIISQLSAANKTIAFMGDDTWVSLYPDSFTHSHPYDSFNVEDLHTVDNGVIEHLFPYLHPSNQTWDVLIGHFLGVDHVGHRVGPNRDTMREKLEQMDGILRRVVDLLDEDTLLVVLGDHGMDDKGNHGGDSELETAAGLWMYSKTPLSTGNEGLPRYTFPGMSSSVRHINQIDLVPTLSLLLGLPIPFNNLGSIIPEVFSDKLGAMRENAQQLHRYLDEYNDPRINAYLASAWQAINADSYEAYRQYTTDALEQLRGLWAQFSITYIAAGLAILALNLVVLVMLYNGIRNRGPNWPTLARVWIETCVRVGGISFAGLTVILAPFQLQNPKWLFPTIAIVSVLLVQTLLAVSYLLSPSTTPKTGLDVRRWIGPAIMVVHALSFASNSFIMWEDRMCLYLIDTVMLVYLVKSPVHPTADMRLKTIGLSLSFGAVTRVMSIFTVCREEQQPYCSVTFYDGLQPIAPKWALFAVIPLALQLPRLIGLTFNRTKSLGGPARMFIGVLWRVVLVLNAADWLLEALFALGAFQPGIEGYIRLLRTLIARASFIGSLLVMPYYFFSSGLCITVERGVEQDGTPKPVTVFGFANAYGTTYFLFLLSAFGLFHQTSAPVAQVALAGMLIAILGHLENVDTNRDAVLMQQSFSTGGNAGAFDGQSSTAIVRPNFTDVVPLVLLGFVGFFSTGHQAVFTTLQWKSAFVGFSSVTWPFSPILVILNTWGAFMLSALAIPLLAIWNISPRPSGNVPVLAHTLQLSLAFIMYHTAIAFASALCSAWLRRHLMVWKVFAPRFMLAGVTLILVDLAVLLAVGVGMRMTAWKVSKTFRCESI